MTVRRRFIALLALAALLLGGGCGGDSLPTAVETDDADYQQGKRLLRAGRNPEALVAFLKVIEKRGDQFSPESHLEAGLIYLDRMKDPVEAIHHFRRFLDLSRKSNEVPGVRGLVEKARLDFLKTFPGRPLEDQTQWLGLRDQLEALQRENDRLKAEIAALGGSAGPAPMLRVTRATTDGAATVPAPAPAPRAVEDSPITPAPVPASPPPSAGRQFLGNAAAPTRPAGRKHVVAPHESLWRIAQKYKVTPEAIVAANRDTLPSVNSTLRAGTELRIP